MTCLCESFVYRSFDSRVYRFCAIVCARAVSSKVPVNHAQNAHGDRTGTREKGIAGRPISVCKTTSVPHMSQLPKQQQQQQQCEMRSLGPDSSVRPATRLWWRRIYINNSSQKSLGRSAHTDRYISAGCITRALTKHNTFRC